MKLIRRILMLMAVVFAANIVLVSAATAVQVTLRERVAPRGSVVRLADVAEVSGDDRDQELRLGALPLMPAPASGTERFLRKREIQDMLAAQGIEVGDFRFAGAEQVAVAAPGAEVENAIDLRGASEAVPRRMNRHAAILAGVAQPAAAPTSGAQADDLRQRLNEIITGYLNAKTGRVVAWKIDCELAEVDLRRVASATTAPVCTGGGEPWTGRQRFTLAFVTAEGPVQIPVNADVALPPVPTIIAVRPLGRGDVIRAADIELRTMEAPAKTNGQRYAFDSVDKLIGMEAKQSIQPGDVVMSDVVQSPILVKRGDLIAVVAQSGGIRVRTSAKALRDGARGDLVQVEAIGSKEKYDVRITGSREAAVFAMSRPSAPERQDTDWAQNAERLTQRR